MDSSSGSTSGVVPGTSGAASEGDHFCRLCFSDEELNGTMRRLFPENCRPDRDLLWKILECTSLKLTFDDDHPAKICERCIERMDDFCDYRMQCLRNDKRINSRRLERKRSHDGSRTEPPPPRTEPHLEGSIPVVIKQFEEDPLESFTAEYVDETEFEDDEEQQPLTVVKEEYTTADEDRALLQFSLDYAANSDPEEEDEQSAGKDQPSETGEVKQKKKRTKKILMFEDYAYLLLSSRPKIDSISWACYHRKSLECRATIGTKANGQILGHILRSHNHPPIQLEKKALKAVIVHAFRVEVEVDLEGPYEIVRSRMGGDVLLYGGDRYAYSHSRKDGCRIWKCGTHRRCPVSIYMTPEGKIFKMSNTQHTTEKILPRYKIADSPGLGPMTGEGRATLSDVSANIEQQFPNPVGTFNYKIVKNANKRNVLMYEGDRYKFYYKKTNGWTVWRCTVSKACQAMIYQLLDESVAVLGETTHDHLHTTGGKKRRTNSLANCPTSEDSC
uniref:ZAD domain-containing protein n=1 Tax=Culex tarsalis TaxID=7177 RepID=A0A1Q3F5J4_CULTA